MAAQNTTNEWVYIPLLKSSSTEEKSKEMGIQLSMAMLASYSPFHHLGGLVQVDPVVYLGSVQLKVES